MTEFIDELVKIFSGCPPILNMLKNAKSTNPSVQHLIEALEKTVEAANNREQIFERNKELKKRTIAQTKERRERDNANYGPKILK